MKKAEKVEKFSTKEFEGFKKEKKLINRVEKEAKEQKMNAKVQLIEYEEQFLQNCDFMQNIYEIIK